MINLLDFISSFLYTNTFPFSLLSQLLPYFDVWHFWENTKNLLKLKTLANSFWVARRISEFWNWRSPLINSARGPLLRIRYSIAVVAYILCIIDQGDCCLRPRPSKCIYCCMKHLILKQIINSLSTKILQQQFNKNLRV